MLRRLLAWLFRDPPYADDNMAHAQAVEAAGGPATHSVALRLDPAALENADLQVRWDIEKTLRAKHPDVLFYDDGYGFARHSEAMLLVYGTNQPDALVAALLDVLVNDVMTGEPVAAAAMIAVETRDLRQEGDEFEGFRVVYPPHEAGRPLPA